MPSWPRSCRWPRAAACRASKGAKIQLIFADNQGTPAAGQNQTLRLISEEKVAAVIGAYQSGITLTASAMAERYGIPFLTPESVAANLTERGFKWFFRATPVAADFARAYSAFLKEQKAAGQKVGSVALVHENTEYGNSVASVIADVFAKDGLPVTLEDLLLGQLDRRAAAGAAAQGEEPRRRDLHLLHLGRDPLRQDHEGAELEARRS